MCIFSVLRLVYVGLFPSVASRNFGIDVDDAGYKLLYTVWGSAPVWARWPSGPCSTTSIDGAWSLTAWCCSPSASPPSPSCGRRASVPDRLLLGFAYFLTATALITIFQENLADTERAVTMPLWFMAFGGSVPIGNLIFGPVIDAFGARWVLLLGAVVAIGLARWCDLRRLPESAYLPQGVPHDAPTDTGPVAGHGIVAGR